LDAGHKNYYKSTEYELSGILVPVAGQADGELPNSAVTVLDI
jgi:hypothetical protein